jgi:hypothetical protein
MIVSPDINDNYVFVMSVEQPCEVFDSEERGGRLEGGVLVPPVGFIFLIDGGLAHSLQLVTVRYVWVRALPVVGG